MSDNNGKERICSNCLYQDFGRLSGCKFDNNPERCKEWVCKYSCIRCNADNTIYRKEE